MTELTKLIFTGACQSWGLLTRKVIECCKSGLMGHSSKNLQKSSAQSSAMEVQNSRCFTGEKYLEQGRVYSHHILGKQVHLFHSMLRISLRLNWKVID